MRYHRFYLQDPELVTRGDNSSAITIHDSALLHQLVKVLRLQTGDEIVVFNESVSDTKAIIRSLSTKQAVIELTNNLSVVSEPEIQVHLVVPAIRKERLAFLVEKASELGVASLTLITTDRAQPRSYSIEKLQKIAIEASEQCGRRSVLRIVEGGDARGVCEAAEGLLLIASTAISGNGSGKELEHRVPTSSVLGSVKVLIGPEGGWSDDELTFFEQQKLPCISLGSLVLRTETAAITVAALILCPRLS